MTPDGKATRINLLSLATPNMRAFHMSWIAFFLCFFAWFGIAPLMAVVRDEMALTDGERLASCSGTALTSSLRAEIGRAHV